MQESIKIPDSVVIAGLTNTETDREIEAHLASFGSVHRVFRVDTPEYPRHGIIEFTHGTAMQQLAPMLPLTYTSPTTPNVTYKICSLASIYSPLACSKATKTFLKELQAIAKLSAKPFELVLQEELSKITPPSLEPAVKFELNSGEQVSPITTEAKMKSPPNKSKDNVNPAPIEMTPSGLTSSFASYLAPPPTTNPHPSHTILSDDVLNPPEVQKVVVEHIVKTDNAVSHFHGSSRLRAFSGKITRPSNEADYETWRTNVDLFLTDPSISDLDRARKIFESLLPPAAVVVKHLGPQALPNAYLELLDSAYGIVADGDECFAKFLSTFQNSGENPSEYLHRLQVVLNTVRKQGGISPTESNRHLLKQFCRGCWDNTLISDLQLEQKRDSPPSFAELLLLLRVEEDRQAAKACRMKHHLGTVKPTSIASKSYATSHVHSACSCTVVEQSSEIEQLKKMVTQIQNQLSKLSASHYQGSRSTPRSDRTSPDKAKFHQGTTQSGKQSKEYIKSSTSLRPGYCYNCGENGHIASNCDQAPNPSLVAFKKAQLQEKRRQMKSQASSSDLN